MGAELVSLIVSDPKMFCKNKGQFADSVHKFVHWCGEVRVSPTRYFIDGVKKVIYLYEYTKNATISQKKWMDVAFFASDMKEHEWCVVLIIESNKFQITRIYEHDKLFGLYSAYVNQFSIQNVPYDTNKGLTFSFRECGCEKNSFSHNK